MRQTGYVARIVSDRGFGFIRGAGTDVFFHWSACQGCSFEELAIGTPVSFDVAHDVSGRGLRASNVRLTSTES